MLKRLALTAIMSTVLAGGALAQAAKDPNQCLQAAHDLAQAAEQKQLSDEKFEKVEDLLNKMEDLCDADRVPEAMAVAKDIENVINAQ